MKKLQIQTEAVTNGVNEQNTSTIGQKKPTKRLTKIRRVVKWSAAAEIVIYLIYVKLLGVAKTLWCSPLWYIELTLGMLVILSLYFYEKKIAKITLWVIISIFILFTLFICILGLGLYFIPDD